MQTVPVNAPLNNFSTLQTMNVILPNAGVYISNQVQANDASLLVHTSALLGHHRIKEAYAFLLKNNDKQILKGSNNLAFGKAHDCIWFAYCDASGKLLTKLPVAALFFNSK